MSQIKYSESDSQTVSAWWRYPRQSIELGGESVAISKQLEPMIHSLEAYGYTMSSFDSSLYTARNECEVHIVRGCLGIEKPMVFPTMVVTIRCFARSC